MDPKDYFLKLLKDIESQLMIYAQGRGYLPDGQGVQDLKEVWEILARHYAEALGGTPPVPFWNVVRAVDSRSPEEDARG